MDQFWIDTTATVARLEPLIIGGFILFLIPCAYFALYILMMIKNELKYNKTTSCTHEKNRNNMARHTITVNLKGLKKWAWRRNLKGLFSINGKALSDEQVRTVVEWAIAKGYERDVDIPADEVSELLNL